jgi:hypothetical protein
LFIGFPRAGKEVAAASHAVNRSRGGPGLKKGPNPTAYPMRSGLQEAADVSLALKTIGCGKPVFD